MAVLEILELKLAPGVKPDDPTILQNMINVRTALRERVHDTKSRCYQGVEDPTKIYIFGTWPDLQTHQAFMNNSSLKDEILGLQQDQTKFQWMAHIEIDDIESLPFDAPIMHMMQLALDPDHVTSYEACWEENKGQLRDITSPYNVVKTGVIDSDTKEHHIVYITGWKDLDGYHEIPLSLINELEWKMNLVLRARMRNMEK